MRLKRFTSELNSGEYLHEQYKVEYSKHSKLTKDIHDFIFERFKYNGDGSGR